jgi:hypothetical protein
MTDEDKKAKKRDWMRQRRKDPAYKAKERAIKLKYKYKITPQEFDEMQAAQEFTCAICTQEVPDDGWKVDHCHATGAVRGLLCNHCNLLLGHSRDNPATLLRAVEYLKASP